MPNNAFTITISATDKATATIRKVNDAMSKITRPFEEVGKSFKSLGREIGIDKIGKNLQKMGDQARDAAKGIGNIVAPLAGISGIATVAGIIHLADSWANLGRNITYTSRSIGIGTTQLQEFQGAARLAGLSGDAMGQSLASLGDTMEDAVYGRNQQALMLFDRLTGGVKRNKNGTMDVAGEYKALAAKIYSYKGNPQVQRLIAKQFGLTSMLPLIQQGPKAMKKYMAELKKIGAIMTPAQIANGNKFALSLMEIESAGNGLKWSIGNALIPALKPLVDELTAWISKNRDLISTDVGDWVRKFAKWIKSVNWKEIGGDITAFIKGVDNVVSALGGVKGILIEIAAIKALSFAGSIAVGLLNIAALTKDMVGLRGAAKEAAAAEAAAAAGGIPGKAAAAGGIPGKAAAVAAAGAAGWAVGSFISKHFVEGTKFGDALGSGEAHIMALLGSSAAREAIAQSHAKPSGHTAAYFRAKQLFNKNRGADINQAMAFFMSKGWTKAQAAGIAANIATESNFRTDAVGDRGKAYGLGQWHPDRQAMFKKVEGVDIRGSTLQQQMDFYNWELLHSQKRAGDMLRNSGSAFASGGVVSALDERPADVQGNIMSRGHLAEQIYNTYQAAPGPYTAGGGKGRDGKVHVEVAVKGLPSGTTAKVSTSGATTSNARVVHTTVGAMA